MVASTFICSPHPLHTAGQRASCCDDGSILINGPVNGGQSCRLGDHALCQFYKFRYGPWVSCFNDRFKIFSGISNRSQTLHFLIPGFLRLLDLICISGMIASGPEFCCQRFHCHLCIAHCLHRIHLISMETAVIDSHKLHLFILEQMLRTGSEV